jgi:Cdc6-like AAA superfamily ATPase
MHFVGREKEIEQIKKALEEEKNVILSGKYGMGRTSLVQHVARTTQDRWRFVFVDFSRTPGNVCKYLIPKLFPIQEFDRKHTRYKSSRFRIATLDLDDSRKHILVLDNVLKLSPQKLDLLRYLTWEKRFQFVSIVESFLSSNDLFELRVQMNPSSLITLRHLSTPNVVLFYQQLSREQRLGWTDDQIKNLAEVTGGYPLRVKEIALRELARSRMDHRQGDE